MPRPRPSTRLAFRGSDHGALLLLLVFGVLYPWTNGDGGVTRSAADMKALALKSAPWNQWQNDAGGRR